MRKKIKAREVDVDGTNVWFIGTTMFDEEEPWFLMTDVGDCNFERERELEDVELSLFINEGVVVEAMVLHPRSDYYGIPDEARNSGMLDWLRDAQELSPCSSGRFVVYREDTGDESPATCVLTVRLPKSLSIR